MACCKCDIGYCALQNFQRICVVQYRGTPYLAARILYSLLEEIERLVMEITHVIVRKPVTPMERIIGREAFIEALGIEIHSHICQKIIKDRYFLKKQTDTALFEKMVSLLNIAAANLGYKTVEDMMQYINMVGSESFIDELI